ncbi:MAG: AsmA family protein [Porticoccus sp.]|nr:AsmA family protein [Porticoccus sp.]
MKWLKGFFTVVVILVLVVIASVTFLLIGIDPNSYKPELEKLAKKNNIELSIEGDLSWSFFPNLAVQAGSTSISGKKVDIPDIHFQQADFILDWKALLSRTIRLRAIAIDGADISVETAKEAANIAALPGAAVSTQSQQSTDTTLPFELAIDELSLTNSRITVITAGEPDQVIEKINFTSTGLNLDGQPFSVTLKASTTLPEQPSLLEIAFNSQIKLHLKEQIAELTSSQLTLDGFKHLPVALNFNAIYKGQEDSLSLTNVTGKLGSASIKGEINALKLQTAPSVAGELSIQNLLLSELPLDEPPQGFKKLGINTQFSASGALVKLTQLKLALDSFNIGGNVSLKLEGPRQLEMVLKGDNLVLPTTKGDSEATSNQAALLTPILAPLALLDGGKGHIELNLNSITSDNIKIDQLHLNLFVNGNILEITDLSGAIFNGTFQATTKIDLKEKTPRVQFSKQLVNIDIHSALSTLADQSDIHGSLTMDFSGTTRGDTQKALMANVNGNGKLRVKSLKMDNINVERSYCEMAALVEQTTLNQTWSNSTQLKDLQGTFQWREQKITLPGFTTGLGNLAISGNGTVNLEQEMYNMLITANLQGERTSETGCLVKSKRIRNRDIPLRCTGSFAENGKGTCLPDKQFINQLLQDKIKETLIDKFLKPQADKAQPQSSDQSTNATEEPAAEKPKDAKEQMIDTLLKGIFQ